jgi:hypothetical protein
MATGSRACSRRCAARYIFRGLDDRYQYNAFNRKGIDEHLGFSRESLCAEALGTLGEAARIAHSLQPGQIKSFMNGIRA